MTTLIAVLMILALLLPGAAVALIWRRRRTSAPREVDWPEIVAAAHQGGYELILTDALAAVYLRNPEAFLLVDTREPEEYRAGHLPGAVNFPLQPTRWGRLRAAKPLAALLGPDQRRAVVFY